MPDLTYSEALKEAFASARADTPIIEVLAIYYSGLVDDADVPSDLFIFKGNDPSSLDGDGLPLLDVRLESDAPRKGGEIVQCLGIPFQFISPEVTINASPQANIAIDAIGREMIELLTAAAQGGQAIEVTWRIYQAGSELVGPQNDPPLKLYLLDAVASSTQASGRLQPLTIGGRRFPFDLFTPERFATLQYV